MDNATITGKEFIADDAFKRVAQLDDGLLKILNTYEKILVASRQVGTVNGANKVIKERIDLDDRATVALKEKERILKALVRQEERNKIIQGQVSKDLAAQRFETQRVNRSNREAAILTSRFANAYDRLSTELNIAKRELKSLTIEQGINATATQNQLKVVNNLSSRIKTADNAAGDFQKNVGNYPTVFGSATKAIRSFVGAFGLIEGVRIAFDFTKESLALAREAKGVEFAFQRLGEQGVKAFNDVKRSTRGLLSDLDVRRAIVEFDNFNISAEEAGTLFEFLAVRATQTGQSIDKLKDSLVEGLSKESKLRIDNLGISASELNAELEKTPDFVQAVANIAKREVAEAGDILDNAANSQEALNAAIENAQIAFGQLLESDLGGFFAGLVTQINKITFGLKTLRTNIGFITRGFNDFLKPIKDLISNFPRLESFINDAFSSLSKLVDVFTTPGIKVFADSLRLIGATLSGLGSAFIAVKDNAIDFIRTLAAFGDIDFSLNPIENFKKVKDFLITARNQFTTGGVNVAKAFEKGFLNAFNFKEETKELTEGIAEGVKEGGESIRPELKKVVDVFEEEFQKASNVFEAFKKTLENANINFGDISVDDGFLDELAEANRKLQDGLEDNVDKARVSAEKQKEIFNGLFSTFSDYYNLDLSLFEDLIDKKSASELDYASTIGSISDSIFEGVQIRYQNEIEASRNRLDSILNDENASDEQKKIAQQKFEEEQKKIQIRQAKTQKAATLTRIAIDTAQGIVSALAQVPKFDFGISASALAATIGGIGAAQAAIVAAQPLPQFFKGKALGDNYEGFATWGERQPEAKISADGTVEVSPNKTTPLFVKKDDIITPSLSNFRSELKNPSSEIHKRVAKKFNNDLNTMQSLVVNQPQFDYSKLENSVSKAFRKAKIIDRTKVIVQEKKRTRY